MNNFDLNKKIITDYIEKKSIANYSHDIHVVFNFKPYVDYFLNNFDSWSIDDQQFLVDIIQGNSIVNNYLDEKNLFVVYLFNLVEKRINNTLGGDYDHNQTILAYKIAMSEEFEEMINGVDRNIFNIFKASSGNYSKPQKVNLLKKIQDKIYFNIKKNLNIYLNLIKTNPLSFLTLAASLGGALSGPAGFLVGCFLGTHLSSEVFKTANTSITHHLPTVLNIKMFTIINKLNRGKFNHHKKLNLFAEEINNIAINLSYFKIITILGLTRSLEKINLNDISEKIKKVLTDRELNLLTNLKSNCAKYNAFINNNRDLIANFLSKANQAKQEEVTIEKALTNHQNFLNTGQEMTVDLKNEILSQPQPENKNKPKLKI